ncbi:hypothetical protein AB0H77_03400 [Streptomyces sp. NPDC050844]|uniref:hypothetical protein n=1 Tax=Streptomyces sp. NPDC050844 TaxID=3155790 RepID=UPI0034104836
MPDPRFDGRPARIQVHRVRPVYANGKCPGVANRAAVLIHGRTETASPTFDLRHPAPEGGQLSTQEGLARAGIDTFAPSLLGYGHSTRFDDGPNDPGNASLRPYNADGSCSHPEGCDRTHNPAAFALDQQGALLLTNPPAGQRRPHSSQHRFARVDTFVRDIRQTIDDAITRAQPTDGKVTLIGYSLGAQHVGRTLYAANPGPSVLPPDREAACTGRVIPGASDQTWKQTMEQDTEGRNWGGSDPGNPTGVNRSPTFSSYGWNPAVAGQLTPPTLVMQGFEDRGVPGGAANAPAVYNALPASMTNKLLVQVQCAAHGLQLEGCTGPRCTPESGTPYGGRPGEPWAGPHSTTKAALIEWIKSGTFNGAASGRFTVDESGVAAPAT